MNKNYNFESRRILPNTKKYNFMKKLFVCMIIFFVLITVMLCNAPTEQTELNNTESTTSYNSESQGGGLLQALEGISDFI